MMALPSETAKLNTTANHSTLSMTGQGQRSRERSINGMTLKRKLVKPQAHKLPRNDAGGVLVTDAELEAAFRFLEVKGTGKITVQGLRQRFGAFAESLPWQKISHMMDGKSSISLEAFKTLVLENVVKGYDPCAEAFKVYDRENLGYLHSTVLRDLFHEAGVREFGDEDINILIESIDLDKDGQIGLEDFRLVGQALGSKRDEEEQPSQQQRRSQVGEGSDDDDDRGPTTTLRRTMRMLDRLAQGDFSAIDDPSFRKSMSMIEGSQLMHTIRQLKMHDTTGGHEATSDPTHTRPHSANVRPRSASMRPGSTVTRPSSAVSAADATDRRMKSTSDSGFGTTARGFHDTMERAAL